MSSTDYRQTRFVHLPPFTQFSQMGLREPDLSQPGPDQRPTYVQIPSPTAAGGRQAPGVLAQHAAAEAALSQRTNPGDCIWHPPSRTFLLIWAAQTPVVVGCTVPKRADERKLCLNFGPLHWGLLHKSVLALGTSCSPTLTAPHL